MTNTHIFDLTPLPFPASVTIKSLNTVNSPTTRAENNMNKYTPIHQSWPVAPSDQIVLYTIPTSILKKLKVKKPLDIVAHWTICINGWCYELVRQDNKKFPYTYKTSPEWKWREYRAGQGKPIEAHHIGYMARSYSHEMIDEVASLVWSRSLEKKYAYDDHNCQLFVRLLIELIGDQDAKVRFPAALDTWVRTAGNTRDGSFFAFAAGMSVVGLLSLSTVTFDPTCTTAAALFALGAQTTLRSSAYLLTARDARGKKIKEGQRVIREQMRLRGRPLAESEGKK